MWSCAETRFRKENLSSALDLRGRKVGKDITKGIYCGDDKRDITAANSAECFSIAAQWGYLENQSD